METQRRGRENSIQGPGNRPEPTNPVKKELPRATGPTSRNPGKTLDTLLNRVGIGNDDTFESAPSSFIVPGSTGSTSLTFTLKSDAGAYNFSFGYFDTSIVPFDPITQRKQYAVSAIEQALARNTVIFKDLVDDPGSTITKNVPVGTELGFFLIPNDTVEAFLENPDSFYPANDAPLFSFPNANPGELDQMLAFVGNGKTFFTFEDLARMTGNNNAAGNSDHDFTDVSFEINRSLVAANGLELHPVGDLNADGFDDVAVREGRDLGVVFGKADVWQMNFEKPDKIIRGFGDFSQVTVSSGDWNADGKVDLAVVDTATDRTFVYNSIATASAVIQRT